MAEEDVVIRISAKTTTKAEFDKARKQLEEFGKTQGFVGGTTKKLTGDLERGLNNALQRVATKGGIATSALAKIGPVGLAAGAAAAGLALAFRSLVQESERITKEAEKLKISTDDYQKSLGISVVLTEEAIEAGNSLGKSWNDLSTSGKNLALNSFAPMAEELAKINKAFVDAHVSSTEFLDDLNLRAPGALEILSRLSQGNLLGAFSPVEVKQFVGPPDTRGFVGPTLSPRVLAERFQAGRISEIEREQQAREKAAKEAQAEAEKTQKLIESLTSSYRVGEIEGKRYWEGLKQDAEEFRLALETIPPTLDMVIPEISFGMGLGTPGLSTRGRFAGQEGSLRLNAPGVDFSASAETAEMAEVSLGDLNQQMANFAHLADVLGPKWAAAFQGLSLGLSGIEGIQGGLGALTLKGGGILGTLTGIGGIAGGIGAIAAPIISLLQGLGGPDIGRDVGRDIGGQISQGLIDGIEESGLNPQFFLKEIFEEGAIGIDRLSEETGDWLSMFERGEISELGVLGEMGKLLPILIENYDELGETGRANIDRILEGAQRLNVDLGATGDQLERLQKGIPELTFEGFTQKFDLNEEQQAALGGLELNLQTDVQRIADDLNVPLNILEGFGPALDTIGIGFTELPSFLEESRLSIEGLFEKLGVPPELQASWEEFTASLGPEALPGADPTSTADSTGAAFASHLAPGFDSINSELGAVNRNLDRLGDKILRGIQELVAQNS